MRSGETAERRGAERSGAERSGAEGGGVSRSEAERGEAERGESGREERGGAEKGGSERCRAERSSEERVVGQDGAKRGGAERTVREPGSGRPPSPALGGRGQLPGWRSGPARCGPVPNQFQTSSKPSSKPLLISVLSVRAICVSKKKIISLEILSSLVGLSHAALPNT